jgi:hypothetical protein
MDHVTGSRSRRSTSTMTVVLADKSVAVVEWDDQGRANVRYRGLDLGFTFPQGQEVSIALLDAHYAQLVGRRARAAEVMAG